MTLNGLVMYVASNFEKVLLGRYWGADAIGIYGRAYQLIRLPTDNLNSAVGEVAFAALSRLQDEPDRLRRYFLKGYALVLGLTLPITAACAFFADDLILVLLGDKWKAAAPIFRLLASTILVYAIVNPLGWLLNSLGLVERGLKIALVFAPFIIVGYVIGLPFGPSGVALAYSTVMALWVVPFVVWAVHGTVVSAADVFMALSRPLGASVVAALLALGTRFLYATILPVVPRLIIEIAVSCHHLPRSTPDDRRARLGLQGCTARDETTFPRAGKRSGFGLKAGGILPRACVLMPGRARRGYPPVVRRWPRKQ